MTFLKTYHFAALLLVVLYSVEKCHSYASNKLPSKPSTDSSSRRSFLTKTTSTSLAFLLSTNSIVYAATPKDELIQTLSTSKDKLKDIPDLLTQMEWDKVRNVLKTPPVNQLWNLGDSQNTLVKLAKETGDIELLEIKDELAYTLQMCDQITYDNAFVYFQPGNGKYKIKEPQELAKKAMSQIADAINIASGE